MVAGCGAWARGVVARLARSSEQTPNKGVATAVTGVL